MHEHETSRGNPPFRTGRIRFFSGLLLVILSFILAKVALPVLPLDPQLSLFIYAGSWGIFFVGMAMCGKEGYRKARHWTVQSGKRITQSLSISPD